jgi:glycerol-3-phosphate acyltransferase PlsX
MQDKPVEGLRKKKDCSILKAIDLVKQGHAEAVVSPGNTGGMVAAATMRLRPMAGLDRPGIAAVMPAPQNDFILLDAGANVECKPIHLAHYAIMGHVYARDILELANPRVGLLSVGTEDVKGNDLTQEALKLCRQIDVNFIGNVEGHDLFANRVDVVVCDGFVGNIVLKTCESLAINTFSWVKEELMQTPWRRLAAFLARNAFRKIKRRMDPDTYGGAPLLGLNGVVMIAHGSARERAIQNAIRLTANSLQHRLNQVLSAEVDLANQRLRKSLAQPPSVSVIA